MRPERVPNDYSGFGTKTAQFFSAAPKVDVIGLEKVTERGANDLRCLIGTKREWFSAAASEFDGPISI